MNNRVTFKWSWGALWLMGIFIMLFLIHGKLARILDVMLIAAGAE